MNQKRDFNEKEFKDIQAESHQFHKNYMEVMEVYEEKENKLEEQSIELFNVFLTSVGIIAGLGFTALGNVKNRTLFFLSETLLLSLIVLGLFILFSYKKSKRKQYKELGENWHSILSPRLDLYRKFLTLKITKKELYKELNNDDKKLLEFKPSSNIQILNLDNYFFIALSILTLGVIFLISSFLKIDCFIDFPEKMNQLTFILIN